MADCLLCSVMCRGLKERNPNLLVECLTPDFRGQINLIRQVAGSGLDVYAHNLETVERLQRRVRDHRAGYSQSLFVLEQAKAHVPTLLTKTSLMLGLGERDDDIRAVLRDLRRVDVDVVTFGQYLRPTKRHIPLKEYITPEKFKMWQVRGPSLVLDGQAGTLDMLTLPTLPVCLSGGLAYRRRLSPWASAMWPVGP